MDQREEDVVAEEPNDRSAALIDRHGRVAGWVFAVLVAVAGPFYAIAGRAQWFFQDEWVFLAFRNGGSARNLLGSHHGHWVTLPLIVYRVLWNIVGLHSYKPYQAIAIALHLVVAILLRAVMRRGGVRPWIATVVAAVFLFFGRGAENVVWAFQISFTGAIAFGLGHLLLADHDDPSSWRMLAALTCGMGALMCSGIGVVMVGIVGLFLLLRRGWVSAAINTVPLGFVYLLWWQRFSGVVDREATGAGDRLDYVTIGLRTAIERLQDHQQLTLVLGAGAVLGMILLVWDRRRSVTELQRAVALPLALVSATVGFFVLGAFSRTGEFNPDYSSRSRFSYVAIALLAPAVAVAFDALIRKWTWTALPLVVLLMAGVPGNLRDVQVRGHEAVSPAVVLSVAHQPLPPTVPGSFVPLRYSGVRIVNLGWLHDGVRSGRIPRAGPTSEAVKERVAAAFSVVKMPARPGDGTCTPLEGPKVIHLEAGAAINFWGALMVRPETPDREPPPEVPIGALEVQSLTAMGAPVTLRIRPAPGTHPSLCDVGSP